MEHLIDRDAIVAEIERRMQELRPTNTHKMQTGEKVDRDVLMWLNALTWVKKILDTLEVKYIGVDLGDPKGDIGVKSVWGSSNSLEVSQHVNPNIEDDLEEAAHDYTHNQGLKQVCGRWESKEAVELQADNGLFTNAELESAFLAGAQWQKEQFEKNRLEHCDSITEEEYNLETEFIDQHLEKYHRIPTILDAIEYGMKKAKEE